MADQSPYAQLTGTWQFWVAASGTTMTALDASPSGSWTAVGKTDGDQSYSWVGALTAFLDNHATGPRKHTRPEEGFTVTMTLVDLTLESLATTLSMASGAVAAGTSGALTTKSLPLRRGFVPNRFALLARGGALVASNTMSPYGAWPGQIYIPQGVFNGEPVATFSKGGRPGIETIFTAEYDDTQSAGYEFGRLIVQSA